MATEYAFQNAYGDPDQRLAPANRWPGYLTTVSGKWTVYVPWQLAFAFPSPENLDGLVAVAERTMVDGKSNAALSGSTVFSGVLANLGDIDLAQYVFDDDSDFATRVRGLLERSSSSILVRIKFEKEYRSPWDPFLSRLTKIEVLASVTDRLKFDFVDEATPFGIMPVSTIIMPANLDDHAQAAARQSFVFQEAVLVSEDGPPWPLGMADELLRYLSFLTKEVHGYRESKPLKALKRALCLARILGFHRLGEQAETVLKLGNNDVTVSNDCIAELDRLATYMDREQTERIASALKEKKELAAKMAINEALTDSSKAIVDEVISELKNLLDREGQSIDQWATQ